MGYDVFQKRCLTCGAIHPVRQSCTACLARKREQAIASAGPDMADGRELRFDPKTGVLPFSVRYDGDQSQTIHVWPRGGARTYFVAEPDSDDCVKVAWSMEGQPVKITQGVMHALQRGHLATENPWPNGFGKYEPEPAKPSRWVAWLEQCSLSGLHAFARDNRVEPGRDETSDEFRDRLVAMARAGEFASYRPPPLDGYPAAPDSHRSKLLEAPNPRATETRLQRQQRAAAELGKWIAAQKASQ